MKSKDISKPLVDALMNGTHDVATLRKIKAMGERLERQIIRYAKEKVDERDSYLKHKFKGYYPPEIDEINIKSYKACIDWCFNYAMKPDFE